jgi:Na+-translocating ferredoxin:NAD+ oxidoreductase RnfC subunit
MADKKYFGFEMHAGRQIDLDHADTSLASELADAVSAWSSCISCGSCSATCPAGLNFRRLHYQIKLSLEVETDNYPSLLNSCLLCGKCQLVCPRGISLRYLSIQIMQKTKHYAGDIPSV